MKWITSFPNIESLLLGGGSSSGSSSGSSDEFTYQGQPSPWATEGDSHYNAFKDMKTYDPVQPPSSAQSAPDSSESGTPADYSFIEYLEGLLSSVGAENEITRKFNSAEAELQPSRAALKY